ncbi:MAG TPA: HAD family hydrolase [Candidatus Mediterraneibacter stercorigallinarum]|uniref:HAD family hydrolase n=1 Tax=Candidatus Mediterraneibacter stercorigallinarum TaxID=2838686 RepID=A0A9D2IK40_9FIRM|nr:HAD family hydrolase [Candidatus Mediterraneibacter stercorigallinarum]
MDGIIFDIDGTLWDSTDSVAASWNRAIRENTSLDLTLDAGILSGLFGKTMTEIGRALFPDDPEEEQARILDICFRYENDYLRDHPGVVYDGVADTIRKLYEKYPLFIVSNCQLGYIEVTMKGAGIESFIKDHLCFGETQVSKGETLLMLMERNNLKSPVYVGDTQGDADACRFAGIPFIFAEYGFGDVPDAETRIRSFRELGEMFL